MSQTDTTQQAHISIHEGDTFRDELNNERVEVLDVEGDVATVRSGGAEWRERVRDLREKVVAGDFTPTGDGISISVESKADIPAPESAQLLYPDEGTAREVADEMGLDGVHGHTLDGDTYWMPGNSHAAFEDATEQKGFADYESFEDCVRHNDEKDDPDAYCASIMRQVKGASEQWTPGLIGQKAEFQVGEQVMWEYQGGTVHGVIREVVDGPVSLDNGAERAAPQNGEVNYIIDEWDDVDGEYQRRNVVRSGSELDESTADIPDSPINAEGVRLVPGDHSPVDQKAEFDEGEAVTWTWDGEPVHGRVAEVRPEQATPEGTDQPITGGDDDAPVYLIDEYDDRVEAYRRENVAKPESSLNESGKDLPPRSEGNYVDSEAWESVTTVVSESDFTAPELDQIAREHPDVLYQGARPTEWALVTEDPVVYRADIPDKYLADRDESLFVPNAGAAENARKVDQWKDEHGDDVAGGAPDGEGARRGNQLVEYHDRGEPLAVEYWEEILNYHERHRAQGNHELDSEYEQTPWQDAGYVSNLNWGGDAGYEQAQRVMDHVESVDQELTVEMEGAVATEQSINRDTLTEADSNRVDLDALEGELREAVEADDFYVYGKASIEQWDSDDPPTHIQMDALEGALGRFFQSETAPGIISRHHQDIPVGVPVESFEFESDTTLEIGDERYQFEAGDVATSHVEDADGDGRPELWLAANISNDNEMSKKTRVLAAQGDLDGFSVTVHRNEDEMTQEGRVVTDCDLHAVTIGTGDQIKNKGSQFDVASFKGRVKSFVEGVTSFIRGGGVAHTEQESTPEGVPDGYEYLPPDEEPPEDHDVVESDRDATYVSPEPTDETDDAGGDVRTDPDPEEDIDRFLESEAATAAIENANAEPMEGFTFHRNLENQPLGERDEWAIGLGLGPGNQETEMSKEDVTEVYEEYQDLIADHPGLRIGGYHFEEGGVYEIELSVTVTDANEAEALGEELNQESVFNLGTEELIFTGGDGDSPIENPDDAREVLETIDSITEMTISVARITPDKIINMADDEADTTTRYMNGEGEEMSFAQIAFSAAKDPDVTVEEVADGYQVNGDLFAPVNE